MALPDHLEKLKLDCDVETYRASGPGGQNRGSSGRA